MFSPSPWLEVPYGGLILLESVGGSGGRGGGCEVDIWPCSSHVGINQGISQVSTQEAKVQTQGATQGQRGKEVGRERERNDS